ncbi:putative lipocalin family protein [Vibrio phage 455E52-1]|nr:putative lipocalin family protein [Vibrio phage 455E52-1]
MKTYNSYEEAKIANPESEIYKLASGYIATKEPQGISVHKCNPADHCMTVEEFLADGHKFVEGDVYLNSDGRGISVVNIPEYNNKRSTIDCSLYILRAAALERIPTETPEEKEVLDCIDSVGGIEWKNGDECEIEMQEGVRRYLFGCECPNNQQTCIVFTKDGGGHMVMPIERLKKPETPQQRKDRERACAIYDMCAEADIFNEESNFWAGKFYDLGYKKDKAHGTN